MRWTAVLALAVLIVLAGCGGGGGGGGGTEAPAATPDGTADATTPGGVATPGPTTAPGTTPRPTATPSPTPDPRPDWVRDDGSVDGDALERRHYGALPSTYRVSVTRENDRNLTLYGSPAVDRLDVGAAPAVGYYDAPETGVQFRRNATPPYAYEFGAVPRPNTDAVYASVLGSYPGGYLSVATLSYEGGERDGTHRVAVTGVDGEPAAPGTEGQLLDLSGTATVGPDGLVRSLSVTETVRRPDGAVVERAVTVRTEGVDAVPRPDWLDGVPRLQGSFGPERRTYDLAHASGRAVENGTTVTLRTESTVLGTATLNATLGPGATRSLALVAENGTERLVVRNGSTPPDDATRLPADAYVVVATDAYVVRAGVPTDRARVVRTRAPTLPGRVAVPGRFSAQAFYADAWSTPYSSRWNSPIRSRCRRC